jgi:hypothetical protein
MEIKKSQIFNLNTLYLCVYLLFLVLNYLEIVSGSALLVATILLNLYYFTKFKDNQAITIMLVFVMTYWLYMIMYYFYGIPYCTYFRYGYGSLEITNGVLRVAGLFMAFLFYFLNGDEQVVIRDILPQNKNSLVFIACLALMLFIILYTFRAGGSFSYKSEGVNSSLYEYYFIFAIVGYCYSRKKNERILLLIVNVVYILALLRLGLRLVVLQIALMVFIEYFEKKFRNEVVIAGTFVGFFFMSFWSMFRSGLVSKGMNLGFLLGVRDGVMITNQGDVFYTSGVQYSQVVRGTWDFAIRIKSLIGFFSNIVLLPNIQIQEGKLNVMLEKMGAYVPGGGFGSMYAYVWLDLPGVILLAWYISRFINNAYKTRSEIGKIYGVFLLFTFFRWYAYNLAIVFKMGFWLLVVHGVIYLFDKISRRRIG